MAIAIIAILAGLLLPALSRAKQKAIGLACLNNQKQMGLAWRMYAEDNGDKLLLAANGLKANAYRSWMPWHFEKALIWDITNSPMFQYARSTDAWKCPPNKKQLSISINYFVGGADEDPEPIFTPWSICRKLTDIKDASRVFTFIDTHEDTWEGSQFMVDMPTNDRPEATSMLDLPGTLHGNSGNTTFADGHGETHRWRDPKTLHPAKMDGVAYGFISPGSPDIAWLQQHAR